MQIVKTYEYQLKGRPELGEVIEHDERCYILINIETKVTEDGETSISFTWKAGCVLCGDAFVIRTRRHFWPAARCPDCCR